jgi:DNA-binding LytR/AlgR family response regulator
MNTRILIIEDEGLAAKRLARLVQKHLPDADIIAFCDSKESAIRYLKNNKHPDLLFLDIQLGDGICFDIFDEVEVDCPVIFTTAYDEFALKAFEINSIDYLLKPISEEKLQRSLEKFERQKKPITSDDIQALLPMLSQPAKLYKQRFLVVYGEKLFSITTSDIAYFCSLEKATFIVDFKGMHYALETSLDKLEELVNPELFFRVNRQYLVSSASIEKMILLSKSRIKLHLKPATKEEVLVSSARTHDFKNWLDR